MKLDIFDRDSETRLSAVVKIVEISLFILLTAVFFLCFNDISSIMRENGENSLMTETDKKSAYIYGLFDDEWQMLEQTSDEEIGRVAAAKGVRSVLTGDEVPAFEGGRYAYMDDRSVIAAVRDENGARAFVYDSVQFAGEAFGRNSFLDEVLGICDGSGTMLLSNDWAADGGNIVELIREADTINGTEADKLAAIISGGGSGFAYYRKFGAMWYCCASPVGINDWYVLYRAEAVEYTYARSYIARDLAALFGFSMVLSLVILLISRAEKRRSYEIAAQKEHSMRASRECLRRLGERPGVLVLDIDAFTGKAYLYGSFMSKFGRDPVLNDFPFAAARAGSISDDDAQKISHMMDRLRRGVESMQSEITMQHEDGTSVACVCAMRALKDENGTVYRIIAVVSDAGDEPAGKETDRTTGLPKGRTAIDAMEKLLADGHCALILCNIDITELDEEVGYDTRERLVNRVASIIKSSVHGECFTARPGADEFAVMLPGRSDTQEATEAVANIRKAAAADPDISRTGMTMYFGTAATSRYVTSFDDLYYHADVNQYNAKQRSAGK